MSVEEVPREPDPEYAMSHQQIADALGISRASVQRAEEEALLKCMIWCSRTRTRYNNLRDLLR